MNIPWIERGSQPDGVWIPLPGASGSEVRLVHAWPGHGLLFFNWGNFRRLQNPAADEYTLEFRNVGACGPGVCTHFVLDWTDALILCPAKHLWPVCVRCTKFVFPHEAHRGSRSHQRRLQHDWPFLDDKEAMMDLRVWCCRHLGARNEFGKQFGVR